MPLSDKYRYRVDSFGTAYKLEYDYDVGDLLSDITRPSIMYSYDVVSQIPTDWGCVEPPGLCFSGELYTYPYWQVSFAGTLLGYIWNNELFSFFIIYALIYIAIYLC